MICFFIRRFLWKVKKKKKKIREAIGEEKMEKTKGQKEVNIELLIVK